MKPPLFWRFINTLRAWSEQDDRMLVEQWIDAFKPEDADAETERLSASLCYRAWRRWHARRDGSERRAISSTFRGFIVGRDNGQQRVEQKC